MSLLSRLMKRKPKNPCYLCGRKVGDDFSELTFQARDGGKTDYVVFTQKICRSCADILDKKDEDFGEMSNMIDWEGLQKEIDELDPK